MRHLNSKVRVFNATTGKLKRFEHGSGRIIWKATAKEKRTITLNLPVNHKGS